MFSFLMRQPNVQSTKNFIKLKTLVEKKMDLVPPLVLDPIQCIRPVSHSILNIKRGFARPNNIELKMNHTENVKVKRVR